uniref:Putative HIT-like protein Rv1262c/MT1300 n=1 Tax=Anthurium amnicola TaxID=1678845 RepID=A0A1D1XZ05_9ARAE
MEVRRLAVLCSHLRLADLSRPVPALGSGGTPAERVFASGCHGKVGGAEPGVDAAVEGNCVFCMIVRGESPAFKLYEDDTCLCILDSNPLTRGHSLIIPKSHYPSLEATPPVVVAAMCSTIPLLSNAIMIATKRNSFNLLVNSGAAAGQVIFHTHLHIIPRKENDCLWTSESSLRRPLKPSLETVNLVNDIREQLSFPNRSVSVGDHESKLDENS